MREVRLLWGQFLHEALTKWEVTIPLVFSNVLGLVMFSFGFRHAVGGDFAANMAVGWIALSMVTIGVSATIVMTIDLTVTQLHYLLSLPVSLNTILVGKMGSVGVLALLASAVVLAVGQFVLLRTTVFNLLLLFVVLILQAGSLIGMLSAVAAFVNNISKLAVVTNFVISFLQFVSVVYFPMEIFPVYVRPILYLNPLTYAINFSRALLMQGEVDPVSVLVLVGLSSAWSMIGYICLKRRVELLR